MDLIIRRTMRYRTLYFCVDSWWLGYGIPMSFEVEDHYHNTPSQIHILQALGAPIPEYAHVQWFGDDGKII